MKKLFVLIVVVAAAFFWAKDFVQSGRLEKYLDKHPNPALNEHIEYFWGMALSMAGHNDSALYRLQRAATKYDVPAAADAMADYIKVLEDTGHREKMLEQADVFLDKYPNHDKADIIRRKIAYFRQG
jgi:hypothetical protein